MSTTHVCASIDMLSGRKARHSLPGGVYGNEDVFADDLEIFFRRHWIVVGVTADIPEPGDVLTVDIGAASVIIVRDEDEQIRAFRNVCRHRGARLREPGKSTVGMLVCPYHQWTYDLEGQLRHASHMGKDFDATCRSLRPVHVKAIGAHMLVCLAEEAPADIAHLAHVMGERFAPYDLQRTKIAFETEIIEDGNWKLVIENNRECYHCGAGHPELNLSFMPFDIDSYDAIDKASQESWLKDGHVCSAVECLDEHHVTQFRTQRLVIAGEGESQTMDTKVACSKLFGNLSRKDLGDTHFWTHNSWTHVMSDHAVISYLIPLAPGKTMVRTKWLVNADAVEGVDYNVDALTEVWKATNAQDASLVAVNHRGTQDPGYEPGPYSPITETYVEQFTRWYAARVQAHRQTE
jgi:glycine betaine catabolism A